MSGIVGRKKSYGNTYELETKIMELIQTTKAKQILFTGHPKDNQHVYLAYKTAINLANLGKKTLWVEQNDLKHIKSFQLVIDTMERIETDEIITEAYCTVYPNLYVLKGAILFENTISNLSAISLQQNLAQLFMRFDVLILSGWPLKSKEEQSRIYQMVNCVVLVKEIGEINIKNYNNLIRSYGEKFYYVLKG